MLNQNTDNSSELPLAMLPPGNRVPAASSLVVQIAARVRGYRLRDFWVLTKPGVTRLAVFCAVIGMFLGTEGMPDAGVLVWGSLGIWLLAESAGRHLGAALNHASGPFIVRMAYHHKNNDSALAQTASSRYELGYAKLHLGYGVNKGPFSSPLRNAANPFGYAVAPTAASLSRDSSDVLVGLTVPMGTHVLLASYIDKNDKMQANQDATQVALGYRYLLSKRTDIYTVYSRIINRNGASYTVGNATEGGIGDRAFNLGIRHAF